MSRIEDAVGELTSIFRQVKEKRQAHQECSPILEQISREPGFVREALERYLVRPEPLNLRNYPVVSVEISSNPYFDLVLNCWIPLPSRRTDVTTKSIHHHGNMLLSTATVFGPGYDHWMFTLPQEMAPEVYAMRLLQASVHPLHHVAFVDTWTCHVPLFPRALSITLALWSSVKPISWRDRIKRIPAMRRNAVTLRKIASSIGLSAALDLNIVDSFDFYPCDRGFRRMKERIEFVRGSNEDHLYSLFHVIQMTGNEHIAAQLRRLIGTGVRLASPTVVDELIAALEASRPIEGRLSPGHYDVPYATFSKSEIERALNLVPLS